MSFELNLDSFGIFEVIDDDLSTLLSTNSNRMTIGTKADRCQRSSNLDLFHLFTFHDIIEKDATVESRTAKE